MTHSYQYQEQRHNQRQKKYNNQRLPGKRQTLLTSTSPPLLPVVKITRQDSFDQDSAPVSSSSDELISESNPLTHQSDRERNWPLLAAQTNTQLLHVLCDLVQAFIDTEKQIEVSLDKLGFSEDRRIDSDEGMGLENGHQKPAGQRVRWQQKAKNNSNVTNNNNNNNVKNKSNGSVVPIANMDSAGAGDLCDDGPDLINPASFILTSDSSPPDFLTHVQGLKIDDDIVLGYSKRLRSAVDRTLHLLKNVSTLQFTDSGPTTTSAAPINTSEDPKNQPSATTGRNISKSASLPSCCTSECDHKQEISDLKYQLREATRMNQILQEKVDEKHKELNSLKARIETQSILDAEMLKEQNDQLTEQLAVAERKIERQAELINQLQSESRDMRDECVVGDNEVLVTETGRRDQPVSPHEFDRQYLPIDRSEDLLGFEAMDDLMRSNWDKFNMEADARTYAKEVSSFAAGHLNSNRDQEKRNSSPQKSANDLFLSERESQLIQMIQEKDMEIDALKNQMKVAHDNIVSAFNDQPSDGFDVSPIESQPERLVKGKTQKQKSPAGCRRKSKRCSGVDLIPSIQDGNGSHNGSESPKLSTCSSSVKSSSSEPTLSLPVNQSSISIDLQVMETKISQLQSVIEKLIAKNIETQSQLDDYRSERTALQRDINFLRKQEKVHHHMIRKEEREVLRLKILLEEKEEEMNHMKQDRVREVEEEIAELNRRIESQKTEAMTNERRVNVLSQRIAFLRTEPVVNRPEAGDAETIIFHRTQHGSGSQYSSKHRDTVKRQISEVQAICDKANVFLRP